MQNLSDSPAPKTWHWNWSDLTLWRPELMGAAILWIMAFHCGEFDAISGNSLITNTFLYNLIHLGSCGVDVFFLLSGIGSYFSLKKSDVLHFYARRISRLLPPYLLISVIYWCLIELVLQHKTIPDVIIHVTCISWIQNGDWTFWYIPAQLIFYLAAPLFLILYRNDSAVRRRVVFAVTLLLYLALNLYLSFSDPDLLIKLSPMTGRIWIFLAGLYIAPLIEQGKPMSKWLLLLIPLGLEGRWIITLIYHTAGIDGHSIYRIWYGLRACAMILIVPAALSFIRLEWLNRFLRLCGSMTLDLYLLHVTIRCLIQNFLPDLLSKDQPHATWVSIGLYAGVILLSFALALLKRRFMQKKRLTSSGA